MIRRSRWLLLLLLAGACATLPLRAPPPGTTRYVAGGDARNDVSHVLPWSFTKAKKLQATAFLFLGDMELTPDLDGHFEHVLQGLDPIPFYPAIGNHEVKQVEGSSLTRSELVQRFQSNFLGSRRTPSQSAVPGRIAYSTTLRGGLHFVVLDNVSQKGFGADQLAWLAADLEQARRDPSVKAIVVGMHKALAGNGMTRHSMDEDGDVGAADSAAALALFVKAHIDLLLASHEHGFWDYQQQGIHSIISGGLGAPLAVAAGKEHAFHHLLQLDLSDAGLQVKVVRFGGRSTYETGEEDDD
jgi:3',5'-cyclic AMP phosphodiesterase CpdA